MVEDSYDPRLYALQQQAAFSQQQDFLRFQIDTNEQLTDLMYGLMGFEIDEDTGEYKRDPTKIQLINQKGANAVMTFLKPMVSKILSLSNLSDPEIHKMCKSFDIALMFHLWEHYDDYQIVSKTSIRMIIEEADNLLLFTGSKSVGGWEGDGIRKTHQTVEERQTLIQQADKPSLFKNPFKT